MRRSTEPALSPTVGTYQATDQTFVTGSGSFAEVLFASLDNQCASTHVKASGGTVQLQALTPGSNLEATFDLTLGGSEVHGSVSAPPCNDAFWITFCSN